MISPRTKFYQTYVREDFLRKLDELYGGVLAGTRVILGITSVRGEHDEILWTVFYQD